MWDKGSVADEIISPPPVQTQPTTPSILPKQLDKLVPFEDVPKPFGEIFPQNFGFLLLTYDVVDLLIHIIDDKPVLDSTEKPRLLKRKTGSQWIFPSLEQCSQSGGIKRGRSGEPRPVHTDTIFNLMETCKEMFKFLSPFLKWKDPSQVLDSVIGACQYTKQQIKFKTTLNETPPFTGTLKHFHLFFFDSLVAYQIDPSGEFSARYHQFSDGEIISYSIFGVWYLVRDRYASRILI